MKAPIRETENTWMFQVCFITDDLERSLAWFATLVDLPVPPINGEEPAEFAQPFYLGNPGHITFRQASFTWRGASIEFIEPGPEPSTWREFLERRGPGVHHLGFAVPKFDETRDALEEWGGPVVQGGNFPGGRYVYVDTEKDLGALVELLEFAPQPSA